MATLNWIDESPGELLAQARDLRDEVHGCILRAQAQLTGLPSHLAGDPAPGVTRRRAARAFLNDAAQFAGVIIIVACITVIALALAPVERPV